MGDETARAYVKRIKRLAPEGVAVEHDPALGCIRLSCRLTSSRLVSMEASPLEVDIQVCAILQDLHGQARKVADAWKEARDERSRG